MGKDDTKSIELNKKQYLALLKAMYLGNWMANANRTGKKDDPHMKEYEEIADYIFSLAPKFGFSENIEHDLEFDESEKMTEVSKLHEEYDEEVFWHELPDRLGERDFFRKYSKKDWDKMSKDERYSKLQECIIEWEEELEKNGIARLEIKKDKN
ncbi:MAG: hypothetical protein Q7R79_00205 [bacterium]|nr:hypothetical protein [bacterium]